MRTFPAGAIQQLEFDKILEVLSGYCRTEIAKKRALDLPVNTGVETIEKLLRQTEEYRQLILGGHHFPNDFTQPVSRELKLLSIASSMLDGGQLLLIRRLADNTKDIFRWFSNERRVLYGALAEILGKTYYEKAIIERIDEVIDEVGQVRDHASKELYDIRSLLSRKRMELRRYFDRIAGKMEKLGYLSDIGESFMNGRRVLAVYAEHKRQVKGVLHSESDSRRTSFIEPEETTELNNEVFSLEYQEHKEVQRILRKLTADLAIYSPLLNAYHDISVSFDLVAAKAMLALDIGGACPSLSNESVIDFRNAYHPLLLLYHRKSEKQTLPVSISLGGKERILVISGPNAGGKTVTLKTVGLLQLMLQSGMLIPVDPDSRAGIFKQLMIHIGDTQSIEFDLSTYSSQLRNMKHFMEHANGRTLFFIDELGSGSDPNLGGAFAEVILEELARKQSVGIVTTHYLNLKIMASKVPGMINGAMLFDEKNLTPLYQLRIGKPGSSYTFSIAEQIGLPRALINRAKSLVDSDHFRLDKLLNEAEQQIRELRKDRISLNVLLAENEKLKKEMQFCINREQHERELEMQQQKNRIAEQKYTYLKDMERTLKALVVEWRKAEDKEKVVRMMHAMLFRQRDKIVSEKQEKKINEKYDEVGGKVQVGDTVKMRQNRQVGEVMEIRGKKAMLKLGNVLVLVSISDLVVVKAK